jgi:alpha-glucosidase
VDQRKADIVFNLIERPFSFSISRKSTGEKLFDTTGNVLVFEEQYIRLATSLPRDPYLYGLGEHTETFRLPLNVTRTLWNRDSYGVPDNSNLYGSHPVYFEQRAKGTHGVFLLNSNGMDVKLDAQGKKDAKLEYNIIGGVLDFYFLAGPGPKEVARQYAEIVGKPTMQAYWGLGNHQCRYGYRDWIDVAEVGLEIMGVVSRVVLMGVIGCGQLY